MEKIPFADYVCRQIISGNFISASTACNYLVYGTVLSGESQEVLAKRQKGEPVFDPDAFSLRIEPKWFGLTRKVILTRMVSSRSYRHLAVTPEQANNLYEAWKVAAKIQEARNAKNDEVEKKKTEALHWWP